MMTKVHLVIDDDGLILIEVQHLIVGILDIIIVKHCLKVFIGHHNGYVMDIRRTQQWIAFYIRITVDIPHTTLKIAIGRTLYCHLISQ